MALKVPIGSGALHCFIEIHQKSVKIRAVDAGKLRSEYVCDAYIEEFIECTVVENHTLGDVEYPKDVLLVKDVKYLGEEIHNLQGS